MAQYGIMARRNVQRGSIESGSGAKFEYVMDERYGKHDSVKQAKASFMREYDLDLAGVDDDFAAGHFDRLCRNLGHYKVGKL